LLPRDILKYRQKNVEIEYRRAGTEESLIAIAGNILKGQQDLHYLSGNLQRDTLTGWNERPPILSDHLRFSTCTPLNLADLHNPFKEQPNFAYRGRIDVCAAKAIKKRGQFPGAAISAAGQQESTCSQQKAAYLP
jgi:hypothetical protein